MGEKSFTLLELIVVIIIIGVLATLGFTQYTKVIEKGRSSEARAILGQLRTAETAYKFEYATYSPLTGLSVNPPLSCTSTHYFKYGINLTGGPPTTYVWADRCTSGGKSPDAASSYTLRLYCDSGAWDNDVGW